MSFRAIATRIPGRIYDLASERESFNPKSVDVGFCDQNFRFARRRNQRFACVCGGSISLKDLEAGLHGIPVTVTTIERPDRHETLRSFLGRADAAVLADLVKFQGDGPIEGFFIDHETKTLRRRIGCGKPLFGDM